MTNGTYPKAIIGISKGLLAKLLLSFSYGIPIVGFVE
jgi:hypothetical protein